MLFQGCRAFSPTPLFVGLRAVVRIPRLEKVGGRSEQLERLAPSILLIAATSRNSDKRCWSKQGGASRAPGRCVYLVDRNGSADRVERNDLASSERARAPSVATPRPQIDALALVIDENDGLERRNLLVVL